MARLYHNLFLYMDGYWSLQFGDYDRKTVQDELDDYRDKGFYKKALRIVTTNDDQASINAAIDKINADGKP